VFKVGFDDNFGNRDTLEQRNGGYTVSLRNGGNDIDHPLSRP
jgi:hypothetical protein